jgi:putative nucleotidyltransferase with HDIG domain
VGQLPIGARVYVLFIIASGLTLQALLLPTLFRDPLPIIAGVLVMALLIAVADRFSILLQPSIYVTVSTAIGFAGVLLFGPAVGAWAVCLGSALADASQHKPWYKIAFNSSNLVMAAVVSGLIFQRFSDGTGSPIGSFQNATGWACSAMGFILVNSLSIALVVALVERESVINVWWASWEGLIIQTVTMPTVGALLAVVYLANPLALGLLVLPVVGLYFSFRTRMQLQVSTKRTLETLADAVDKRDPQTFQHSHRVTVYAEGLARRIGLQRKEVDLICSAAKVHDLGKVGIPDDTLRKPGRLDESELRAMREHSSIGASIVSGLALYQEVRGLIEFHHERFDGRGYPKGLAGEAIPLGARILAIADSFDAMLSDRVYRRALSYQAALAELRKGRGGQFDPQLVDSFIAMLEEGEVQPMINVKSTPEAVLNGRLA